MKKIITAIGDKTINEELRKDKEIQVLFTDIQYKEGIIECMEQRKNIDYILLSEKIVPKEEIKNIVIKIKEKNKKSRIIYFFNNKENINKIKKNKIDKIFFFDINTKEILNYIKEKSIEKKEEKNFEEKRKKVSIKKGKIISICGIPGVGKSYITTEISKNIANKNKKVMIVDFDFINNSIHTLIGKSKYSKQLKNKIKQKEKIEIKDFIIKYNKNLKVLSGIEILIEEGLTEKIIKELKNMKEKYNYIFIDILSENIFNCIPRILENSDKIYFIIEPTLVQIEKAKRILKKYNEDFKIDNKKISIIINKYNKNSINIEILKNIFIDYKILGKIKLNDLQNIKKISFLEAQSVKKTRNIRLNKILKIKNTIINMIIRKEIKNKRGKKSELRKNN